EEMRRFFLTGRLEGTAYLEHLVWSYCLRQFALISNSLPNEKANKLTVAQARQTEEFLDASLEGEVSLADLADHLDLPVMPLNHGIRECFGAPFHQVLLEKRVARARHLLSQSEASIADIAYACGFSSQQHMTNVFSKRLGVSHGKYRKLQ
ncbi:MAG: AraC family transcriptional regulator, partial [Pseudomonadota bacterium]